MCVSHLFYIVNYIIDVFGGVTVLKMELLRIGCELVEICLL